MSDCTGVGTWLLTDQETGLPPFRLKHLMLLLARR
jgi:hypothetical protein